jgi:hypothetical protein
MADDVRLNDAERSPAQRRLDRRAVGRRDLARGQSDVFLSAFALAPFQPAQMINDFLPGGQASFAPKPWLQGCPDDAVQSPRLRPLFNRRAPVMTGCPTGTPESDAVFHVLRLDAFTLPERLLRVVERGDGEFRPQGSACRNAVTEDEGYASIAGLPGKFDR